MDWDKIFSVVFNLANLEIIKFWALTYGWNCRGGGVQPPVHVYRCLFLSENGL